MHAFILDFFSGGVVSLYEFVDIHTHMSLQDDVLYIKRIPKKEIAGKTFYRTHHFILFVLPIFESYKTV